jgi:hypothetical protein
MSQLAASDGQPRYSGGGTGFFLRRFETVRFHEDGWQEPCESRGSRTVLRGTGGEIPPVYPTPYFWINTSNHNILGYLKNKRGAE